MWRARPASREPGLPRASALAASSRSAVPALACAPRSWPHVGASRTAASPVFLGPVPRGNPPRPRGARGWARPHLLWSRWRLRVCVRRGGGRSPAAAGLSGWRSTRAGRSPCGGCLCVFGSCAGRGGVDRSRGWRGRPAPRTLRLVWRESEGENGERWYPRWRCEGGCGVPRPSLPRWAPSRRTRPLGAVGARGPRGSSSSPLLLHPGGTRSGAGPRDAAASVRRCESPPGVAGSGRERVSLTRCVPASLGGYPASVGCASRGLRVSKILHPRRPPLPPASRGPLRRFAGSSSRAAGCRLFPARLLALFFPRLGACPPFLTATSDQTWRPAEFKHISQRRKRN